jgi:hypothetical protein
MGGVIHTGVLAFLALLPSLILMVMLKMGGKKASKTNIVIILFTLLNLVYASCQNLSSMSSLNLRLILI